MQAELGVVSVSAVVNRSFNVKPVLINHPLSKMPKSTPLFFHLCEKPSNKSLCNPLLQHAH